MYQIQVNWLLLFVINISYLASLFEEFRTQIIFNIAAIRTIIFLT
jgi:hypothetical protein